MILASRFLLAAEPPPDLARRVAARETATERERAHYTYRQTVSLQDYAGEYREVRDIVFSPAGDRSEVLVGRPRNTLVRLRMTEEDFRDLREVQPMLLTEDTVRLYETRFRGEETIDNIECWLLAVRPRQILDGQRLFDGVLWIYKTDYSIVRFEGSAVPQIVRPKQENLFPRFTTVRRRIGDFWFPSETRADDTLRFRTGPVRVRMRIQYSDYRKFGVESTIQYGDPR